MFSKPKPKEESVRQEASQPAAAPQKANAVPSIVSPDLTITGNLDSKGDVQIDGHVDGDVHAESLTIGEHGSVHGAVKADKIRVCGKVIGEISAGAVTLAGTARVEGDVVHDRLAIEPGAHLEGHCRRRGAGKGSQASKPAGSGKPQDRVPTAGAQKSNGADSDVAARSGGPDAAKAVG